MLMAQYLHKYKQTCDRKLYSREALFAFCHSCEFCDPAGVQLSRGVSGDAGDSWASSAPELFMCI